MNERDQNIVDALRRWITGDITQKEEIRLDEQAGEDPFLREALEGYRRFPKANHEASLESLRRRLRPEGKSRKLPVIRFPYRIAAGVAILLAVGLFWFLNPAGQPEMASVEKKESARSGAAEDRAADEEAEGPTRPPVVEELRPNTAQLDIPAPGQDAEQARVRPPAMREAAPAVSNTPNDSALAFAEEAENEFLQPIPPARRRSELSVAQEQEDSSVPLPAAAQKSSADSRVSASPAASPPPPPPPVSDFTLGGVKLESATGSRLINGRVLDPAGTPLNGVLVVTPGERIGTITNVDGKYQILLDSNIQRLEFQRTGYAPQRVTIPAKGDFVQVTLDESSATISQLAEAKTQAGERARANPQVSGALLDVNVAQPMVSFRRFERYLQRKLQYPQEALEQGVSGEVILSFTIQPNGDLKNIQALQGPGAGLNEEAIRLLQEGPKWEITNGGDKEITIIYRLNFSL